MSNQTLISKVIKTKVNVASSATYVQGGQQNSRWSSKKNVEFLCQTVQNKQVEKIQANISLSAKGQAAILLRS